MDIELYNKALNFANYAHREQKRKYNPVPYIGHCVRVAHMVEYYNYYDFYDDDMVVAALVHDVVEDTDVPIEEIINNFGERVGRYVIGLTQYSKQNPEIGKLNRESRKLADNQYLSKQPFQVKFIKLCDRIDNLGEMSNGPSNFIKKYLDESEHLLQSLYYTPLGEVSVEFPRSLLELWHKNINTLKGIISAKV